MIQGNAVKPNDDSYGEGSSMVMRRNWIHHTVNWRNSKWGLRFDRAQAPMTSEQTPN